MASPSNPHDGDARWKTSRAGARAGRGFRYQDAVSALLAIQQWSGANQFVARVVPEGLDDVELIGQSRSLRLQIKSRHDPQAAFSHKEVAEYLAKAARILTPDEWAEDRVSIGLVLERPVDGQGGCGWAEPLAVRVDPGLRAALHDALGPSSAVSAEQVFARTHLIVEEEPIDRCVDLLVKRSGVLPFVARLIAHDLRIQAGSCADANFRRTAQDAAELDASMVEATRAKLLLAVDPSGIDEAIRTGMCESVDFRTELHRGDFYDGVNVVPGHVAAGLVFKRQSLVDAVLDAALGRFHPVVIAGPSGSGKSALAWLAAHESRHVVRWHDVRHLESSHVASLSRLALALEATDARPVGFVFDDIGRRFADLWESVVEQLSRLPGVVVVGTVREEDFPLIVAQAVCEVVRPTLDEDLAERLWEAARKAGQVRHLHWQEPLEESRGLLLEYVHLLTQGRRLRDTLLDQMRARLSEARDCELNLLGPITFAGRYGALLNAAELRNALRLDQFTCTRALQRLIAEHAVREVDGKLLGGLHELRSRHLDEIGRELLGWTADDLVASTLPAVRTADLAHFLGGALNDFPSSTAAVVRALAARLVHEPLSTWTAAFHGLGLATCDLVAEAWVSISRDEQVDDRFSALLFNLATGGADFSSLPQSWEKPRRAMARFADLQLGDLRGPLQRLLAARPLPAPATLRELLEFTAAQIPLPGTIDAPSIRRAEVNDNEERPLDLVLEVIATHREVSVSSAMEAQSAFGGGDLLDRVHAETPWTTRPVVRESEGQTIVASDIRFQGGEEHGNANAILVQLCERLLSALPQATTAVCRVLIAPDKVLRLGEYDLWTKRLGRQQTPSQARIAWTRAQGRRVQALVGTQAEGNRLSTLARVIDQLPSLLKASADFFCRGEALGRKEAAYLGAMNLVISEIPPPRPQTGTSSDPLERGQYQTADPPHDFVTGIRDLAKELPAITPDKAWMTLDSIRDLESLANKLDAAEVWRWSNGWPQPAIAELRQTLAQLIPILAYWSLVPDEARVARNRWSKTSRKHFVPERASVEANSQLTAWLEAQVQMLMSRAAPGLAAKICVRYPDDAAKHFRVDCLAAVPVASMLEFWNALGPLVSLAEDLPKQVRLVAVPELRGLVVGSLGMGVAKLPHPCPITEVGWANRGLKPFVRGETHQLFEQAKDAVWSLSAIHMGRDRALNGIEQNHAANAQHQYTSALAGLENARLLDTSTRVAHAMDFLMELRALVDEEAHADVGAEAVAANMGIAFDGQAHPLDLAYMSHRLELLDLDCELHSRSSAS